MFGSATTAVKPFSFGASTAATTSAATTAAPATAIAPFSFGATTTATVVPAAAPTTDKSFVGLGGTSSLTNGEGGAAGTTSTGGGKIEKIRDVAVPPEIIVEFDKLKRKLEEQKKCVDDLSAASMDRAFEIDRQIDALVKSLHVIRAQMRTTNDRISQLRTIQRQDSHQTQLTHRTNTTLPMASARDDYRQPINYLLSLMDGYDSMIDTYTQQVLALERLIESKLGRATRETGGDDKGEAQLETMTRQIQQFDGHYAELKNLLNVAHERVESVKFHVRHYHKQLHGVHQSTHDIFDDSSAHATTTHTEGETEVQQGPDVFSTPNHRMLLTMAENIQKAGGGGVPTTAATAVGSTSLFGAARPTGGLFGATTAPFSFAKPATTTTLGSGGGLFGASKTMAAVAPLTLGAPAAKPLFGTTSTNSAGTLFGANTATVKPFSFAK